MSKQGNNSIRNTFEDIFSQSKKSYNKTESDIIISAFPSNNPSKNNENSQKESLIKFEQIFSKAMKPYYTNNAPKIKNNKKNGDSKKEQTKTGVGFNGINTIDKFRSFKKNRNFSANTNKNNVPNKIKPKTNKKKKKKKNINTLFEEKQSKESLDNFEKNKNCFEYLFSSSSVDYKDKDLFHFIILTNKFYESINT